jgi:hypothetical protein
MRWADKSPHGLEQGWKSEHPRHYSRLVDD